MSSIKLRPYQLNAVNEIRTALAQYRRVLFQLPTGGGKTVIFSYIVSQSQRKGSRVLILSSRTEILKQNGGALERMGLDIDYLTPRTKGTPTKNVCCGMAQTLKRRVEKEEWKEYLQTLNLVVLDECHEQVSDFVHHYLNPLCYVIGVTATPRRCGKAKQLGDMYAAMVEGITTAELIKQGYLSKATLYSIAAPKLDVAIDYGRGDYNQKALAAKFEDRNLYVGVVREYLRLVPHKKTICFCVSAKQAIEVTKEFVDNGVSARYLLSGNFDDDSAYSGNRNEIIDDFSKGKFEVLVNVGIGVAGLDVVDIEVVILNYSTLSVTKYLQSIGRGARVTDTKHEFKILDCGANYKKHGIYEAKRSWCLYHDSVTNGMLILKDCDPKKKDINGKYGCGAKMPSSVTVCKKCGWVFPTKEHEYEMYLEKVEQESAFGTIEHFVADKRRDKWDMRRIMKALCFANIGNEQKVVMYAYRIICPEKTERDARAYWEMFKVHSWDKIKHKRSEPTADTQSPTLL